MAASETTGTGCSSVAKVTDLMGTDLDLDLRVLCNRVRVLEQKEGSDLQSDRYLRNR